MVFFHLIDNLKRGGAEILLLDIVKGLNEHKNFIIICTCENDFTTEEIGEVEIICLDYNSPFSFIRIIKKLRTLINTHQPDLVHAHLPFSSAIARIATPDKTKLFVTIHNKYSDSLQKKSWKLFFLEKFLHSKNEVLLFVSKSVKEDYDKIIKIKGRFEILHNFIGNKFFDIAINVGNPQKRDGSLNLVAVGSLKKQKNFHSLIDAFALLENGKSWQLSIYGNGPEKNNLQELIERNKLKNVQLMGVEAAIEKVLPHYDAFILPSAYEGFGIAPLEAAACGLPLLLSDIDVFKEVTQGYALFFSPREPYQIASAIKQAKSDLIIIKERANLFKTIVRKEYSKKLYLQKLINIYCS